MESCRQIRLWGQVIGENGTTFPGIRVKLLQKIKKRKRSIYKVVQETWTDEKGIYNFWVQGYESGQYKIIIVDYLR